MCQGDYSGYLLGVLNLEYPKQQNQAAI
uniref:Uncharacterized protein n=1 Tax=mine drainage metagenome TaxID=410659 RepID=E6PY94_9ZZZZ